jgi:DUF1680 family protein
MAHEIDRRAFLKTGTTAAAGALAIAKAGAQTPPAPKPADVHIGATPYTPVRDYPIRPVPYYGVAMKDEFWAPKIALNAAVTIPFQMDKNGDGRGLNSGVLEAAIMSLRTHPNPALQALVDARVRSLAQAPERLSNNGFEIAATYFNTTGNRTLVDVAIKSADALYQDFVTRNPPFSGGERDAINCVQLYRVTHDKKHLDLAKHYLDIRGLANSVNRSRHNQSYKPVLEQSEAVGHAVNCVSLMVSLVDVGVLTGLKEYFNAAQRMWRDIVEKKMYVTGGVGSTGNEGFGEPYVLPNISAYAETCAVLMFMTLNHRMFMATGDGKYLDVLERGLYNNAIDGVSAAGNRFFYVNRLASAGDGRDLRWERASLECCPPNLVRFFASMPGYIYAQDPKDAIFVNLYVSSGASFKVAGREVGLEMTSEMPWGGRSSIAVSASQPVTAAIKLRIPGWTRHQPVPSALYSYAEPAGAGATVRVNGARVPSTPDAMGYVTIDRAWKQGDVIEVDFPMAVRRVVADARVADDRGRAAIERGPVVYCAEWPEASDKRALDALIEPKATLATAADKTLFGAATLIKAEARRTTNPVAPVSSLTLIPYHLWANRGAGEMSVWLPSREFKAGDVGPAGGYIFYVNPNYAKDGWRYLEAAPFDQSAGAKWGGFRTLIPGARGTAVGTGKQNTLDMIAACKDETTAASLCASLNVNGVRGWFLPSRDELALMYANLKATGAADFRDTGLPDNFTYWASSQQTADMAVHIDFADLGRQHGDDKDFPRRVRAIRTI